MYPEYCVVAKARIQRFKVSNQSQRQNVYNTSKGDISLCRILYNMWVRPLLVLLYDARSLPRDSSCTSEITLYTLRRAQGCSWRASTPDVI